MEMSESLETAPISVIAEYLDDLETRAYNISNDDDDHPIWEKLYDFVFSDECIEILTRRFGRLDYYNPDTTYREDVCAYISAFKDYADDCNNGNSAIIDFETWCRQKKNTY